MKRTAPILIALAAFSLAGPTLGEMKFTRLDETHYLVSHTVGHEFGSSNKVAKMLYIKVASLCVAAGFKHFEVKNRDIVPPRGGWTARGTVEVELHLVKNEDSIECKELAEERYIKQAKKELEYQFNEREIQRRLLAEQAARAEEKAAKKAAKAERKRQKREQDGG